MKNMLNTIYRSNLVKCNKIFSTISKVMSFYTIVLKVLHDRLTLIIISFYLSSYCYGQLGYEVTISPSTITLQQSNQCYTLFRENINLIHSCLFFVNYIQYTSQEKGRISLGDNTLSINNNSNPIYSSGPELKNKNLILNQIVNINSRTFRLNGGHPYSQSEIQTLQFNIGAEIIMDCHDRLNLVTIDGAEFDEAYRVNMGNRSIWSKLSQLKVSESKFVPIDLTYRYYSAQNKKPDFGDIKLKLTYSIKVSCIDLSQHCETAQTVRPLSGDSLVYIGNTNSTTLYNARFNYYPERGGLSSDIISNQTGREKIFLYRHNRNRLTLLLKTAQNQNVFVLSDCEKPIFKYKVSPNNRTSKSLPAGNYYIVIDSEKSNEGGFTLLVKSE